MDTYCEECKKRLYPDNPTVYFNMHGRNLRPLCYSCPNYEPSRNKEEPVIEDLSHMGKRVEHLRRMTLYLQGKLNEHTDRKNPTKLDMNTKTLIKPKTIYKDISV